MNLRILKMRSIWVFSCKCENSNAKSWPPSHKYFVIIPNSPTISLAFVPLDDDYDSAQNKKTNYHPISVNQSINQSTNENSISLIIKQNEIMRSSFQWEFLISIDVMFSIHCDISFRCSKNSRGKSFEKFRMGANIEKKCI